MIPLGGALVLLLAVLILALAACEGGDTNRPEATETQGTGGPESTEETDPTEDGTVGRPTSQATGVPVYRGEPWDRRPHQPGHRAGVY